MKDIKSEIKRLEVEQAKIGRAKEKLLKEARELQQQGAKLEKLVKDSGFKSPKALVEALVLQYSLRLSRKAKGKTGRRKKTKVTPALRDQIKADLKAKMGPSAISRKHGLSYAVVANVKKGVYDKLK